MRIRRRAAATALLSVAALAGAVALVSGLVQRGAAPDEPGTAAPGPSPTPGASVAPTPEPSTSPPPGSGPGPAPTGGAVEPPPAPAASHWKPAVGLAWQWQLTQPVDQTINVPVYDIDGFDNSAAVVRSLHAKKRKVICYVEVGAAENFRPDYKQFPASVLGRENGWAGERWLDIRQTALIEPIVAKRFDMCRTKGFDAIEPDLMDNFANETGFPITAADQLRWNTRIAAMAHARGLGVGLKNDAEQVPQLVKSFDFAVVEECAEYSECAEYEPFVKAGKAVFHAEYALQPLQFCPEAKRLRFSSIRKNLRLDSRRTGC